MSLTLFYALETETPFETQGGQRWALLKHPEKNYALRGIISLRTTEITPKLFQNSIHMPLVAVMDISFLKSPPSPPSTASHSSTET